MIVFAEPLPEMLTAFFVKVASIVAASIVTVEVAAKFVDKVADVLASLYSKPSEKYFVVPLSLKVISFSCAAFTVSFLFPILKMTSVLLMDASEIVSPTMLILSPTS